MKMISLLIAFMTIAGYSFGQIKIPVDSAINHIGEKVIICSKVYGVKSTEKVTFINLGSAYPKSPVTIVIFAKDLGNFEQPPSLLYTYKNVCVTGILKEYKGKIQIIISKPEEISIQQ